MGALNKISDVLPTDKIKQDVYYSDLNLTEGEKRDIKDQANVKGGVGYDPQDKKPFIYADVKKDSFDVGVEAKSKDNVTGNVDYNFNEKTKAGITASKDDFGKYVGIHIKKTFNKGGSILAKGNKLAKHKPTKLY